MNVQRRCWTSSEEDIFLRVWQNNLGTVHGGRRRTDVCRDLQFEFANNGIDATVENIKVKMDSFKRKFSQIIKEDKPRKPWKHFDTMVTIMGYPEQNTETLFEPTQVISDDAISFVCVDEVAEYSQVEIEVEDMRTMSSSTMSTDTDKAKPSDSPLSIPNMISEKAKPRRRFWVLQEEQIFLNVWHKYVRDLRTAKVKLHVYKEMALELQSQGIKMRSSDIKAKIESFTRKFRKERDLVGNGSKWIHYAKVCELLNTLQATSLEQYSEHSNIDNSCNWFDQDTPPAYPPAYANSSLDCEAIEQPLKKAKGNEYDENCSVAHSDNAVEDECYLVYPENLALVMLHEGQSMEQPVNANETICRPQLTEQFGRFVIKELNMLNDDLLTEAKKRIYDIICIMHMKQMQQNKATN
ncbi:uncharacterized protein LOC111594546 [Drosophila hydei]|uniref:Uncharacterized protein LOC111594546 n=1 Tax=Drosophila hydei TaxID=7224 RepID=A0A6J1LGL2_DROHY|nr:uncharacterized protein LOC111594546 [Drosophila hydei]